MNGQEQEEEELPPYVTQPPIVPGQMTEGMMQYQLEANEILEDIEHVLKSEYPVYDKTTAITTWVAKEGIKPLINEKGCNSVIAILRSRLTKIFIMSDFDEEVINKMSIQVARNMIDDIYFNWETYEIPSTSAASIVVGIVSDTTYATLRKAHLGGYQKFLRTISHIQEIQHLSGPRQDQAQMQQPRQPFSLNPFKRH